MLRFTLLLTAIACTALPAVEAQAGRFTCRAAQNLARASAPDRDTVIVEPDDTKKECRFSINGEPAGSPPRQLIMQALELMRRDRPSEVLAGKNEVDWLGFLLLAASHESSIDDDFRRLLRENAKSLGSCFQALEQNAPSGVTAFNNGRDLFCRASQKGGDKFDIAGKSLIEVESAVQYLVVGAARKGGVSYVFVPFELFRAR